MFRAFNMGVGMVAVVPAEEAQAVVGALQASGESAWVAGEIVAGDQDVRLA
jgi:phosphoribosylformylglycinamidine cyclo-ligase